MPDIEVDDSGDAVLSIDPVKLLYNWSQLPKSRSATEAIQLLLSSITLKHSKQIKETPTTRKRTGGETEERQNKRAKEEEWKCQSCNLTFKSQSVLRRHMNNKELHPPKQQAPKSHEASTRPLSKKHRVIVYSNGVKKWRCGVCKKTLSNNSNLHRHIQTIHAKDQLQSEKEVVNKDKIEQGAVAKDKNTKSEMNNVIGSIMYVCGDCTVATAKIDNAFEHAQLHHLECYNKPIMQTCNVCKFAIEVEHFADHARNHGDNEYIKLKYNPFELLKADWYDMFSDLSEAHVDKIKSTSIYEHTRKVKMNSNNDSGIPLYQCELCEMYVSPKEVEDHCHNGNFCATNQPINHICSDCEIFFHTSEALNAHEKVHSEGLGVDSFRTVSFNSEGDAPINKALRKLRNELEPDKGPGGDEVRQPNDEETQHIINKELDILDDVQQNGPDEKTQHRKNKGIKVLDDRRVNVCQFCCGKFIPLPELEAHKATHKDNSKADDKSQRIQEVAREPKAMTDVKEAKNPGDNTYQGPLEVTKSRGKGVNPENNAHQIVLSNTNHLTIKETKVQKDLDEFNTKSKIKAPPSKPQRKIIGIKDNFSKEMENELRLELKQLIKESDLFMHATVPMVKSSIEALSKENDALDRGRSIKNNEDKMVVATIDSTKPAECNIKPDPDASSISNGTTQNADIIEIDDSDDETGDKVTEVKIEKEYDGTMSPRPSSRYILSKMLPSTSSEFDLTDVITRGKKNGRKRKLDVLIDEARRIRDIISSRD